LGRKQQQCVITAAQPRRPIGRSEDGFERAQRLGAKGFVGSPLDAELLVRAIRRLRSDDDGASLPS